MGRLIRQWIKRAWHAIHEVHLVAVILEWLGWSAYVKALFISVPTAATLSWAVLEHLPTYQIAGIGVVVFALSGIGANAWGHWVSKRRRHLSNAPAAVEPPPLIDLRRLTSAQLLQKTLAHSLGMRMLEANYRASEHEALVSRPRAGSSSEQQAQAWEAENQRSARRRGALSVEFETRFRPEAVALWKEMEQRLGIFEPYADGERRPIALADNMLAGVAPITEAADFLDALARRLR